MPEHFLLDTGPLQEFLILQDASETRREWPDEKFQFHALLTQPDRDDFPSFLRAHQGHLGTSSSVVTEIYRLLQNAERRYEARARQDLRRQFWSLVCTTFRELRVDERTVPIVEMSREVLADYGPTDASLLELAIRSRKEFGGVIVLTADRRLYSLCRRHDVNSEYVPDQLGKFRGLRR